MIVIIIHYCFLRTLAVNSLKFYLYGQVIFLFQAETVPRKKTIKNNNGNKKDKLTYSTSQLFNFAPNSYLERTSRPVYAIVFLLPFIVFYELGTIFTNTDTLNRLQVRVVAFVWLKELLEYLGTGSRLAWIAPPFVVVIILIGLQVASGKKWSLVAPDFSAMFVECILLAVPLIVFSLFLNSPQQQQATVSVPLVPAMATYNQPSIAYESNNNSQTQNAQNGSARSDQSLFASIVTGIGAGIYEELVFRLILICLLMMFFQDLLRLSHKSSIILSVLISAALFSAHHHVIILDGQIGQTGTFNAMQFGFRTIAGVYFAILFAIRGFGITAGTHACYDIIATIVNAYFFRP